MIERNAERLLHEFTARLVPAIGFSRIDDDRYGCPMHDATALLSFPFWLSARGVGLFTARVGLRFEGLAKWLGHYRPTLGQPIHLLRRDKTYTEWEFAGSDDLEKCRDPLLSDLRNHALPFLERYSRLPELRKTLESPNVPDWVDAGLDVDRRVTTLAAIQVVAGDRAGAIKTVDDWIRNLEETLTGRPHQLRKRRFDMDSLRDRLLAGT